MPNTANMLQDQSQWYLKTPQEMSRYEIADLEAELRSVNEAGDQEEPIPDEHEIEAMRANPEYIRFMGKMKKLVKLRHGVIKRYFEKYKNRKAARNEIIEAAEASEEAIAEIMREDHVHFLDANPEIRDFME